MAVASRLPGIQFDVVPPPASLPLVRMDIAVFVGFAASGPLQTPVAVEDIAHFEEIFGNDLAIANDPVANQQVYALLPSSVRAFFRNGGSRCWIVRVAGSEAVSNRFAVPGLSVLQDSSTVQAYAYARSEGSWSDELGVSAALRSDALQVIGFASSPPSVRLLLNSQEEVVIGDLLRLSFGNPAEALWLFADRIVPAETSPPLSRGAGRVVDVTGQHIYWDLASPLSSFVALSCDRLTMDLFVRQDEQVFSLTELGFAPSHPRYWASLPSDVELYNDDCPREIWTEAAHPRFPLAGQDTPKLTDCVFGKKPLFGKANGFYLPFTFDDQGQHVSIGPLPTLVATSDAANLPTALVRDGVSDFSYKLFLDPSLGSITSTDVMQEADYLRYQRNPGRYLTGIHAALAIDEATIIAVPDAVQRGWFEVGRQELASPPDSSPLQHPDWWHFLDCHQVQQIPRVSSPRMDEFQDCDLLIVDAPVLQGSEAISGGYLLQWQSDQQFAAFTDFLEEAADPGFVTATVIYQGNAGQRTIYGRPAGNYYYRLRRQAGAITSNFSNGVARQVTAGTDWQVNFTEQYHGENPLAASHRYSDGDMLAIHGALLRMCAARGDLFAVLAMPQHYRDPEAMAHAAALKTPAENQGRDFSFGALYHPWLLGREENDLLNLRVNPPDGAMAGIMAWRSSQRGAWISPANEPLHGVVDMTPSIARSSRQALQDSLINLVRQEPAGFLCLCELTLSDDPDLSPINVRRLLSFLRKTALRAGVDYVFEPNGDAFRRAVQRGFETLLDSLFIMGAFAGRTASQGYQVVVDSSVNTPRAAENGQFFVELRVAPSLPMRFLTVRLLQTADRTFVTEGGA